MDEVVIGHASLAPYLDNPAYLGAIVGRYANRIARGRFTLDGTSYQLATNDGPNHLHGGRRGFDQHLWTAAPVRRPGVAGVEFERTSEDGEEGYPGTLQARVTYLLTSSDTVALSYEATSDAPTIVNLTQHSYFNLGGAVSKDVLDHRLTIVADAYLPVDDTLIPTGEVSPVAGTPFDFRGGAAIGPRLRHEHPQLERGSGFDHTFVLAPHRNASTAIATLHEPLTGRRLEIATTEPGVHFYGGQLLDRGGHTDSGRRLERHAGLCLETHHFPDSPNQPAFPPVTIRPGQTYTSMTTWRFSTDPAVAA
jgi:aldose 1-epimerase